MNNNDEKESFPDLDLPDEYNFEYLDHPADIQLHSWGESVEAALENIVLAMFNYMTPLSKVKYDENASESNYVKCVSAHGHDILSLVYDFLNEWLFMFHDNGFIAKHIRITSLDLKSFEITSEGRGEFFNAQKHSLGTEVKAVTYSNMQLKQLNGRCDIWVIVDI